MRRTKHLTVNEAVNIRQYVFEETRPTLRNSWVGMCEEILSALEGDKDHDVIRIDGRRIIYREGYPYPHFIEVGSSAFCCPFWQ